MERALDPLTFLAFFGAGLVAGLIGLGVAIVNEDTNPLKRAGEAAILALLGSFLAHGLVSVVLDAGNDSKGVALLVGWAFFGIHGLVDTVPALLGLQFMTKPEVLLVSAGAVGALTGGLNGTFRIYPWNGFGVPQFLADVTWGLTGSTIGGLVHLYNCLFGERAPYERLGANQFLHGFHMPGKDTFAFTQGSVMSNLKEQPGQALWRHERLHVFQNRAFGPFFTLTYLGWMAVMLIPAVVAGILRKQKVFEGGKTVEYGVGNRVEAWCYYSNPWETWAYVLQRKVQAEHGHGHNDIRMQLSKGTSWSDGLVAAASVPFFVLSSLSLVALGAVAL